MRAVIPIREALEDPNLLGRALGGPSWRAWRVLLIAAMGEPLDDEERVIFKQLTGRDHEPDQRVDELALVIGRRGGKTRAMAVLAVYLAGLCEYELAAGEKGIVLAVAQSQLVAKVTLNYATGCLRSSPVLKRLIASRTADSLVLTNGITIEVRPASFRAVRGPTYVAAICDEIAFWWTDSESANPDTEIVGAIRPTLGLTGGILVMASSPYVRKGVLWTQYQKHFGPNGSPAILVAQAATRDMNPKYPQAKIDAALQEDYARNSAEFLAQFRSDAIEAFIARAVVEACVPPGIHERKPRAGVTYVGFVDPAGSTPGGDSFTLAIAHRIGDAYFLDLVREVPPLFSPENVCAEFSDTLKLYGITKIQGDNYAKTWPVEQFAKSGIRYEQSARRKSDIYLATLPLLNSGRIELLDHPRLVKQLCELERRTARGGSESVDHPPRLHDDIANAVCGSLLLTAKPKQNARSFAVHEGASPSHGVIPEPRELPSFTIDPRTGRMVEVEPAARAGSQVVRRNGRVLLLLAPGSNHCIPGKGVPLNIEPVKGKTP